MQAQDTSQACYQTTRAEWVGDGQGLELLEPRHVFLLFFAFFTFLLFFTILNVYLIVDYVYAPA